MTVRPTTHRRSPKRWPERFQVPDFRRRKIGLAIAWFRPAQSRGRYIGILDSDDLLEPTALEETASILESRPEFGMVYTDHVVIDSNGQRRGIGRRCQIPYSKDRMLLDFMTFHFRLIRMEVFTQIGRFDETYPLAMDYDLCLRIAEVTEIEHLSAPFTATGSTGIQSHIRNGSSRSVVPMPLF